MQQVCSPAPPAHLNRPSSSSPATKAPGKCVVTFDDILKKCLPFIFFCDNNFSLAATKAEDVILDALTSLMIIMKKTAVLAETNQF